MQGSKGSILAPILETIIEISCSSVKPQSHTSRWGSGEELSERTTSSKMRSETARLPLFVSQR